MKFNIHDIVEYVGGDNILLGLHGTITDTNFPFVNVNFHYLKSDFIIKEDDLKLVFRSSQTPTTTIWGGQIYEPVTIPMVDEKISFANSHKCQWKFYFGLNQKFEYCTICDTKRDVE